METVTILTPTYNRKIKLERLYKSLCNQTVFDFKWLVIDDGSTDETERFIKKNIKKRFEIEYVKKENGGKHTALNLGFSLLKTDLVAIVDSDDYLIPDAIEIIIKKWNKYKNNKNIMGLVFKKMNDKEKCVSDDFIMEEFIDNYNKYVINKNVKGDKFEIFKSSIIKNYRYPEFKNEKFVGEGVLWSILSKEYDMVFINKSLYICEYLENGLTNSGRKMRLENPNGGMYHSKEYLDNVYDIKVREKNALLFLIYARFAKKNIFLLLKNERHFLLLFLNIIPSLIIYEYWKKKYM